MKKFFYMFVALVITLTFSSCIKDDAPNFHFVALSIVSAELPETFSLNQTYSIKVTYNKPNKCTDFSGFDVTPKEITTRNVVVVGTKHTDQEACDQAIAEETKTFNFKVIHSQTYIFRFWQSEDSEGNQKYFEIEVPVE